MHRTPLLQMLARYQRRYPEETACVERYRAFVSSYPTCFERSLAIGHVTGSAWVVNPDGTHTLLTHHKKLNKWLQLGGHADGHPHVLEVARQEAREESGLSDIQVVSADIFDIDIHLIPARGDLPAHHHYDVRFALQASDAQTYQVSDESHDLAWVEIRRLREFTQETSMLRMAAKWTQFFGRDRV